jgi:hypothetical protein
MLKSIVIGIFVLVLSSCDGPASTPTDPNQSFSLPRLQSTSPGKVYNSKLTGRDSNGVRFTGSSFTAIRPQTMLDGVSVIPQDFIISFSGGKTSMTFTGTRYVDLNGNLISVVSQTTGQTCTPEAPDDIPATVKIGDFGILPALECSNNTTHERNWRVEDAGNGNIYFISNATTKNQFNTIVLVTDVISKINGNGEILSFKVVVNEPTKNYMITLKLHIPDNSNLPGESLHSTIF